jgi:putative hydrolase of the HAD superfamily
MLGAWQKIAAHALACTGAPGGALAAALAEDFAARRRKVMPLFPGVPESLARLRERGIALALVTNGDASQQRDKLEHHDLARYFDVGVIEGEFGAGKPEEVVYRQALAGLDARPDGPENRMDSIRSGVPTGLQNPSR